MEEGNGRRGRSGRGEWKGRELGGNGMGESQGMAGNPWSLKEMKEKEGGEKWKGR
jgi:hypothetical protein